MNRPRNLAGRRIGSHLPRALPVKSKKLRRSSARSLCHVGAYALIGGRCKQHNHMPPNIYRHHDDIKQLAQTQPSSIVQNTEAACLAIVRDFRRYKLLGT
jgi:hypothetical protein